MKTGKAILLGCGVALVLALALLLGGGVAVYHLAKDPEGMAVYLDVPEKVRRDEAFDVRVIVVNERKRESLKVTSVDFAEDYLRGLTVRSSDPAPRGSTREPFGGGQSYTFEKSIPAGATNVFIFRMRAKQVGAYKGDVDVYEGVHVLTLLAQTEVIE